MKAPAASVSIPPLRLRTQVFRGSYLVADRGKVSIARENAQANAAKWLPCDFSIVSSGTEAWHIAQSAAQKTRVPLGYMAVCLPTRGPGVVAPVPHGASFLRSTADILSGRASIELIALARFQLIAAVGIGAAENFTDASNPVAIIGSGPVAFGAALELARLGCNEITMLTKRAATLRNAFDCAGPIQFRPTNTGWLSPQVLECTGTSVGLKLAQDVCQPRGRIGLLGSPRSMVGLSPYGIHRRGLILAGMHELVLPESARQHLYTTILAWLRVSALTAEFARLVRIWPRRMATRVHFLIRTRTSIHRIHVIDWRHKLG